MSTSKQKLEERLGGASLARMECEAILKAVERAETYAERSGHSSLIGEVAAIRRATRDAHRRATNVAKRLRDRINEEADHEDT